MSQAAVGQRSAHRPQCTHRSSSLTMTRPVCFSGDGYVQGLSDILRGRLEPRAQIGFFAVVRDGEAIDRADVDAGVALDAQLGFEHRLHVAVEAALHLFLDLLDGEAELHFDVELLEALLERHVRHQAPLGRVVVVRVGPLVHAHLGGLQIHAGRAAARRRLLPWQWL